MQNVGFEHEFTSKNVQISSSEGSHFGAIERFDTPLLSFESGLFKIAWNVGSERKLFADDGIGALRAIYFLESRTMHRPHVN